MSYFHSSPPGWKTGLGSRLSGWHQRQDGRVYSALSCTPVMRVHRESVICVCSAGGPCVGACGCGVVSMEGQHQCVSSASPYSHQCALVSCIVGDVVIMLYFTRASWTWNPRGWSVALGDSVLRTFVSVTSRRHLSVVVASSSSSLRPHYVICVVVDLSSSSSVRYCPRVICESGTYVVAF